MTEVGGDGGPSANPPHSLFDSAAFSIELAPGFPAVHDAYRRLGDQKDMVCGAYALTYLLRAYGFTERDDVPVNVDSVAATAGTVLEPHNDSWLADVRDAVGKGQVPTERAEQWFPHEYYDYDLAVAEEGGTSPEGLVRACREVTDGRLMAMAVPATVGGEVQLTADALDELLSVVLDGQFGQQLICNYNLRHTLAPVGLLGHKYNLTALITQWNSPDYFRTLDWDVGHFTSVAGRLRREDSNVQYLVIRDSYKSFGWSGYHLQPEDTIRNGLIRPDDDREGGLLLVGPSSEQSAIESILNTVGLQTGTWDNGSPYQREINPFNS